MVLWKSGFSHFLTIVWANYAGNPVYPDAIHMFYHDFHIGVQLLNFTAK